MVVVRGGPRRRLRAKREERAHLMSAVVVADFLCRSSYLPTETLPQISGQTNNNNDDDDDDDDDDDSGGGGDDDGRQLLPLLLALLVVCLELPRLPQSSR